MLLVADPAEAEQILLAGSIACPHCRQPLRPHGHGRTRTVRGLGPHRLTITPRRARCHGCGRSHILLPTAVIVRRADSTEAIGTALLAKATGSGVRSIADRFDRPRSTVRRWLRGAAAHAPWLHQQGVQRVVAVDREILAQLAPQPNVLAYAINTLLCAAARYRHVLGVTDPVWSLIGMFTRGRLLAPRRT